MTPDQINSQKIALALGQAVIARIVVETEAERPRQEIEALSAARGKEGKL